MRDFHRPSIIIAARVKELHNETHKLICNAKREYYQKITEEANSHNIWNIRGWTKSRLTYTSPPLKRGPGRSYTVSHNEKCDMLRESLFPEPPMLANPPPINLEPKTDDLPYTSVTRNEVRDALFTAAQLNAPGISGLTGRAWQWAWAILEDEIFHLIRLCAECGYHPKPWKNSIAVALQKPNRDYSLPRSYRLIQLLEVLGKVLEWIQARRLSYIAAKHDLFPLTQYGGIPG